MTDRSAIEWTQATWNPVTGCDRISPGCQHCYALTLAKRLQAMGQAKYQTDGRPPTRSLTGNLLQVRRCCAAPPVSCNG
jgi:protein gp37